MYMKLSETIPLTKHAPPGYRNLSIHKPFLAWLLETYPPKSPSTSVSTFVSAYRNKHIPSTYHAEYTKPS